MVTHLCMHDPIMIDTRDKLLISTDPLQLPIPEGSAIYTPSQDYASPSVEAANK